MYEDPERSARMIDVIRTDGKRKDFSDEVIFEQLGTPGELSRGGKSRWGVYIILEGGVTVSRGQEVSDDDACGAASANLATTLNEDEEEAKAAPAVGTVEAGGEGDDGEESKPAATSSAVLFASDAPAAETADGGAAAATNAAARVDDAAPSDASEGGANKSVRFDAVEAETIGGAVLRDEDDAAEHSDDNDWGVLRHTAMSRSRASLVLQKQKSRPKSRLLTPHYKHRMHRILKGKECKTHLHVEDSHTIELFKGSGHVCGMLSVLTGHPRCACFLLRWCICFAPFPYAASCTLHTACSHCKRRCATRLSSLSPLLRAATSNCQQRAQSRRHSSARMRCSIYSRTRQRSDRSLRETLGLCRATRAAADSGSTARCVWRTPWRTDLERRRSSTPRVGAR